MQNTTIEVEVAYATPARQKIIRLKVALGSTALEAVQQSNIQADFPEIELSQLSLGIFSKAIKPDTVLREYDRVEIYRPLLADPKTVRRQRAEEGKAIKKTT